jgi:biofilm PGA synthesis N-glycosyltransferase PgaC
MNMLREFFATLPYFCFAYPFVMAWYWMAGGLFFYFWRERKLAKLDRSPLELEEWPPFSILVPCFNEAETAVETLTTVHEVDYPDFEIIAINDGSTDGTAEILDRLAQALPRLRVIHLSTNGGKARALNIGAHLARHELLLCIDGDALLDRYALRWAAYNFLRADVGAFTGNPRIRNRTTELGQMQVGEFSSIVGLIKRAQTAYGWLFAISGVVAGFRRKALQDAGWWSSHTPTEDVDVCWRIQMAGWRVIYAPSVVVWILMPETLKGLWQQRLRWAEGGVHMMVDFGRDLLRLRAPGLIPTYLSYLLSVLWSYAMFISILAAFADAISLRRFGIVVAISLIPAWWGLILVLTYLLQALVSHFLDRRYEPRMLRSMFWVIWYPAAFWLISLGTTVVAVPRVLFGRKRMRGLWVSPDRGLR